MIGIMDVEYKGDLRKVVIIDVECDYLILIVNKYFMCEIVCLDIIVEFSGVCLLCDDELNLL